jgi:hypothetical protein
MLALLSVSHLINQISSRITQAIWRSRIYIFVKYSGQWWFTTMKSRWSCRSSFQSWSSRITYTWHRSSHPKPTGPFFTFGGHTTQTTWQVEVCLGNKLILHAHLCPPCCLPFLPFVPGKNLTSFWTDAFAYSAANIAQTKTILSSTNQNLSSSPERVVTVASASFSCKFGLDT